MSGLQDDWYVAGPDGEAIGPLSRLDLAQRLARGAFHREALAWHVDHAEWQPVARAVAGQGALSTQHSSPPMPSRREPDAARPPPPAQTRSAQDKVARETKQLRELRERLAGSTAQAARSKVTAAGNAAAGLGTDAAKTAALVQQCVRRLLARMFDLVTLGVFAGAIGWGLSNAIEPDGSLASAPEPIALLWLGLFLWVPIEGALLAAVGTTPGKALLGLRVVSPTGGKPGIAAAWSRAVTVLWRGMGLGIPPLTVLGIVVGGVQTIQQGSAPWDGKLGLEVQAEPFDSRRWQIAIAALVAALVFLSNGVWTSIAQEIAIGVAA
jgi:uncharacterized RDD family membrane protein YckC